MYILNINHSIIHSYKIKAFLSRERRIYPLLLDQRRDWESTAKEHHRQSKAFRSWKRKPHWLGTLSGTQESHPHPQTAGCYSSPASHPDTGPSEEGPEAATPPTWSQQPHRQMSGFPVITVVFNELISFWWYGRNVKVCLLISTL